LISALLGEVEVSMPFQGFDQSGQEEDLPFGADLVGICPCQERGLLELWSVVEWSLALEGVLHLRRIAEEPNGIFASIASDGDERIEQEGLLGKRRLVISGNHLLDQLMPGTITQW